MKNANKKSKRPTSFVFTVLIIAIISMSMPALAAPVYEIDINNVGLTGGFKLVPDADGAYLCSEFGGGTYFSVSSETQGFPATNVFAMEYLVYIPNPVDIEYYLYPCFRGLILDRPSDMVEMAFAINAEGIRPYLKDQVPNETYDIGEYGKGKDLSYGGGLVKQGGWNKIYVMVDCGKNEISMYVNNELVLLVDTIHTDVISDHSFNVYPSDGSSVVPLRFKEIKFYDNAEVPAAQIIVQEEAPVEVQIVQEESPVEVQITDNTPAAEVQIVNDSPAEAQIVETPAAVRPSAPNTGDAGVIVLIGIMFAAGAVIFKKRRILR